MTELIKRTYRITKKQDKLVKKKSKKASESGYIRALIDKDTKNVVK